MTDNIVRYKEEDKAELAGEYKMWLGDWHVLHRSRIQKFKAADEAKIKAAAIPVCIKNTDWHDVCENMDEQIFDIAYRNNKRIMRRVLPKEEEANISDFIVTPVVFKLKNKNMMKVVLRNIKTNDSWLLTGTDEKPKKGEGVTVPAIKEGWFVYRNIMIAPAAYWIKFRNII